MEEANLVVRVKIDPKRRLVEDLGAEAGFCSFPDGFSSRPGSLQGAENLMAGSNRQILEEGGPLKS